MALRRKFNGKTYYFDSQYHSKARAESLAYRIRKAGGFARVVRGSDGTWEVWVRS